MNKLGIVQGRLSPPIKNQIQAFPLENWENEFSIYNELELSFIDWLFKFETIKENPLCSDSGIKKIKDICKRRNIRINGVLSDYFMEKRLFGECKKEVNEYYIEQEFTTSIQGTKYDGDYDYDLEMGYTRLNEWLDNMLVESTKEPKILGCDNCMR